MDINSKLESVSVGLAAASLVVSIAAAWIARSSLSQAKQVADRDRRDWKQRKWFDLYLKANEAYDALDRLQTLYAEGVATGTEEFGRDWNNVILLFRELHTMATVFPKNSAIDELLLRGRKLYNLSFPKGNEGRTGISKGAGSHFEDVLTASPELLRCQGVTRNGTACTAWAMEGGDLGRLSRSQAASADLPNTSHRKNRCPNGALTWGNSLLSQ